MVLHWVGQRLLEPWLVDPMEVEKECMLALEWGRLLEALKALAMATRLEQWNRLAPK
jgi:hypothetical protein